MRLVMLSLICLSLLATTAAAQIAPEQLGVSKLAQPDASWFMLKSTDASYIFDGDTGEMQGLISNTFYSPAIVTVLSRSEAYLVESFYSRGVHGTRQDVLTVVDMTDLSPKDEIDIPDKAAALPLRNHIGMLGDDRHIVIFNMTPAQSVSIVDVVDRQFQGEISTPGCAVIMPVAERAFLMICGDGTLQYLEIDRDGKETRRERTAPFFSVAEDPVFDKPVKTNDGWLLISHEGQAFEVSVNGARVAIGEPWSILSAQDKAEQWRPGGWQPFSVNRNTSVLYTLMHQGGVDTHGHPGSEVWVFDLERRTRVGRLALESQTGQIQSSQEDEPKLYVFGEDGKLYIYDGHKLRMLRAIEEPGVDPGFGLIQILAQQD